MHKIRRRYSGYGRDYESVEGAMEAARSSDAQRQMSADPGCTARGEIVIEVNGRDDLRTKAVRHGDPCGELAKISRDASKLLETEYLIVIYDSMHLQTSRYSRGGEERVK